MADSNRFETHLISAVKENAQLKRQNAEFLAQGAATFQVLWSTRSADPVFHSKGLLTVLFVAGVLLVMAWLIFPTIRRGASCGANADRRAGDYARQDSNTKA